MTKSKSKGTALLWVTISYILAAGAAIGVGFLFREEPQWLYLLLADLAATLVIFAFGVAFKNSSFYDPYWSVIPIWACAFLLLYPESESVNLLRAGMATAVVTVWGVRLTWNWWRGWAGLHHEDWRYVNLRHKTGLWFQFVNFTGIMLMPTVLVFLGMLPLLLAMSQSDAPLNVLDGLGLAIGLAGVVLEGTADNQLRRFRLGNPPREAILETGLWKYSRHPNYFGEITFWYGVFCFGLACGWEYYWTGAGALGMTALFLFISIPMIDKRMLARRPGYAERMKRVSKVVPWLPKKQA